jgi:thiol-disulfide isomerase/thioredoxin/uncharacterized membrane protein YphA (DoxX/SURF4 family)
MSDLALFLRLLLAGVFALAAVGKFLDIRGTQEAAEGFGVPAALAPVVAVSLPLVEALIALALVPASSAVAGAAAALVLLAMFIILISVQLARGRRPDCHCFGQLHSTPVGLGTLVRNLVLAGGAVIVITADGGKTVTLWWDGLTSSGRMGFVVAGSLGLVVAAEAAILWKLFVRYGKLLVRVEELEALGPTPSPSSAAPAGAGLALGAVAPPFALQGLHGETITLAALLARSRPTLLLFTDPQCGPCGALIPEIVAWQQALENRLTLTIISRGSEQDNVAKFLTAGVTGVLLQRDREVADAYLSPGTPSCVLVDPEGAVASAVAAGADSIRRLVRDGSGLPSAPVAFTNGSHGVAHGSHNGDNGHGAPLPPRVGETAPDINLPDLDGQRVGLGQFRGRDVMLVFWNPECGFCEQLLPELRGWEENDEVKTLDLLVITTGSLDANRALSLRSKVLIDDAFTVGPEFGAHGTPIAVAIDSVGNIASDLAIGGPAIMELLSRSRV